MKCKDCGRPVSWIIDEKTHRWILVEPAQRFMERREDGKHWALNVNGKYVRGDFVPAGTVPNAIPVYIRHSEVCKGGK